jgi:protein-disulfide isomerase
MRAALLALALAAAACSAGAATNNVATMDSPAKQACADLRALIQARSAGGLSATELRTRLGKVYDEASTSANPIIKARAVALFVDATELATGAESSSLAADLAAMNTTCTTGST